MQSAIAARKAKVALARTVSSSNEHDANEYDNEGDVSDDDDDVDIVLRDDKRKKGTATTKKTRKRQKRRHWSPSVTAQYSGGDDDDARTVDDDDGEDSGEELFSINDVNLLPPRLPPTVQEEQPKRLSSFTPIHGQNTFPIPGPSASILVLQASQTICLLGTYELRVVSGSITLSGIVLNHTTKQKWHRVFAPRCSPVPIIQASSSLIKSKEKATASPSIELIPEELVHVLNTSHAAIICVKKLETGIEGLGNVCKIFHRVFEPSTSSRRFSRPSNSENAEDNSGIGISGLHLLTKPIKDIQPFLVPPTWDVVLTIVSTTVSPSPSSVGVNIGAQQRVFASTSAVHDTERIILVKGPKKSGKSTLARTLANKLLQSHKRVAFLECDLGQSEFTPGGLVALNIIESTLFGPPFTHPSIPISSHFIGNTTPKSTPALYISAVRALIRTYREEVIPLAVEEEADSSEDTEGTKSERSHIIPLIVNTMGWTKGLGADLELQIESIVEPTDILEVQTPVYEGAWSNPSQNPSDERFSDGQPNCRHISVEPFSSTILSKHYTPADYRTITMLSYFYARFPSLSALSTSPSATSLGHLQQSTAPQWDTSQPLCAIPPYEIDVEQALDGVFLVGAGMEDVVSSEIERVLNGAVVALTKCDPDAFEVASEDEIDTDTAGDGGRDNQQPKVGLLPYVQGRSPPDPSSSNCLGLAFIRSVSSTPLSSLSTHASAPRPPLLHMLTPLPSWLLSLHQPRVIIKGDALEIPVWGWLPRADFTARGLSLPNGASAQGSLPYLQWGKGEGVGSEKRRVRRNLMRKSLL